MITLICILGIVGISCIGIASFIMKWQDKGKFAEIDANGKDTIWAYVPRILLIIGILCVFIMSIIFYSTTSSDWTIESPSHWD